MTDIATPTQRLAEALIPPLKKRRVEFYGPVPVDGRDIDEADRRAYEAHPRRDGLPIVLLGARAEDEQKREALERLGRAVSE